MYAGTQVAERSEVAGLEAPAWGSFLFCVCVLFRRAPTVTGWLYLLETLLATHTFVCWR